jgi:hypothetical protein
VIVVLTALGMFGLLMKSAISAAMKMQKVFLIVKKLRHVDYLS